MEELIKEFKESYNLIIDEFVLLIQEQVNDKINIIEESTNEDEIKQLKKKKKG